MLKKAHEGHLSTPLALFFKSNVPSVSFHLNLGINALHRPTTLPRDDSFLAYDLGPTVVLLRPTSQLGISTTTNPFSFTLLRFISVSLQLS